MSEKTSVNDVTGDKIITKTSNDKFRDGWDLIYNKENNQNQTEEVIDNTQSK